MTSSPQLRDASPPILIVEDDTALRETLAYNLRADGHAVVTAVDGIEALEFARQFPLSLVLLDLMLPRVDGLYVCRQLRARPETANTPILMLTARGDESEKVIGLELGADDYVTKPFSWKELRARIRALLRRPASAELQRLLGSDSSAAQFGRVETIVSAGELRIDLERRQVWRSDREIDLPARLFDLLVYMVRNKGIVLTRDRILQHVWGYDFAGETRTVDVHVRWLREKLEDDPSTPTLVLTVRGVGYRLKD